MKYEQITILAILLYLQPLVKKGIVGFATSEFHFCQDCYQRYIKDLEFKKNKSSINSFLEEKILREVDFKAIIQDDKPTIEVTGPEDIVSHGSSLLLLYENANNELSEVVIKKVASKKSSHFSKKEIAKWGLLQELTRPIMSDLTIQNYYSELYGTQSVIDTEIDFKLLSTMNQFKTNALSNALANGLAHSVHYLADIEISKLLKLRENEGESFNVYRDAFSQAIQSVAEPNENKIKQLFNNTVRPELDNIELTIKNSRKLLWGSLAKDFFWSRLCYGWTI